jgi:hypothetical protein
MNWIESLLLDVGFSWSWSKLLPFFMVSILGSIGWMLFQKRIPTIRLKVVFFIVSIAIPFFSYFIYSPLYRNDFNGTYVIRPIPKELIRMEKNELVVLALPHCPFCFESIAIANKLIKRNPGIQITYLVLSHEPTGANKFRSLADKRIRFKLAIHFSELETVCSGMFPAFLIRKDAAISVWDFNQIGPSSLDEIEQLI